MAEQVGHKDRGHRLKKLAEEAGMADLVTRIIDCVRVRDQTIIACYRLSYELTLGPSSPPPRDEFIRGRENAQGLANPPFEGIEFVIRDP